VRPESIMAATLVFFDIATDFLVQLEPGTTVWQSGENYDWLKRYDINKKLAPPAETRPRIADELRSGLPLDVAGIRTALAAHLTGRIEATENQLIFVTENLPRDLREESALKIIQFWHSNPGIMPIRLQNCAHTSLPTARMHLGNGGPQLKL